MRGFRIVGVLLAALVVLSACSGSDQTSAREKDERTAGEQLKKFQKVQPVPVFDWSQLRQNLIEIETAQATSTATTSFFFNQGVTDPVGECPSIGLPIPATYQLTNPMDVTGGSDSRVTVPQLEANGVYTGDTTGTYTICVNGDGDAYAFYWEGFVATVAGPAQWDAEAGQVRLIGDPSFDFSEARK